MSTKIKFDNDHSITVDEDLGEVESRLVQASGERNPPLARLTDARDQQPVLVNAALVRLLFEPQPRDVRVHAI
jgi:hypothetical protein